MPVVGKFHIEMKMGEVSRADPSTLITKLEKDAVAAEQLQRLGFGKTDPRA